MHWNAAACTSSSNLLQSTSTFEIFSNWLHPVVLFTAISYGTPLIHSQEMLLCQPKNGLGCPERYLFSSSKRMSSGSKHPKIFIFFFKQKHCSQGFAAGPYSIYLRQHWITSSASFLTEISVSSPRKLFIFIIFKNIFWIKVSKKYFIQFWKRKLWITRALLLPPHH